MKYLLCLSCFLLVFPVATRAETTIHPVGWTPAGNGNFSPVNANETAERTNTGTGNPIITPEEHRAMQKQTSSSDASWFSSGQKPTLSKNADGSLRIKKVIQNKGHRLVNSVANNFNN